MEPIRTKLTDWIRFKPTVSHFPSELTHSVWVYHILSAMHRLEGSVQISTFAYTVRVVNEYQVSNIKSDDNFPTSSNGGQSIINAPVNWTH
jgi:hypothetical protein